MKIQLEVDGRAAIIEVSTKELSGMPTMEAVLQLLVKPALIQVGYPKVSVNEALDK